MVIAVRLNVLLGRRYLNISDDLLSAPIAADWAFHEMVQRNQQPGQALEQPLVTAVCLRVLLGMGCLFW